MDFNALLKQQGVQSKPPAAGGSDFSSLFKGGFGSAPQAPQDLEGRLKAGDTGYIKGFGNRTAEQQVAGAKHIAGSISAGNANIKKGGVGNVAKGAAQDVFGTVSGAAQAAFAPVTAAVSPVIQKTLPVSIKAGEDYLRLSHPTLAAAYDRFSPALKEKAAPVIAKVQEFSQKHPDDTQLAGDILNTALLFVGGEEAGPSLKEAASQAFTKEGANAFRDSVATGAKGAVDRGLGLAEKGQNKIIGTIENASKKSVSDKLAGQEASYQAGKISKPETQAFIPKEEGGGGKTFGSVVDNVHSGIKKFREDSIKTLNDVKEKITGSNIKPDEVGSVINDKITSVLGRKAESRGLKGFDATSSSVDDLKSYGLINDSEEKLLQGMVKTIRDNPDATDRGILNLKEDLYKKYFKSGNQDYDTSNKIVKSVYDGLNDLVGRANPKIRPALDAASANIKDVQAMEKQLLGTGAEREAKLRAIATKLKDGTLNSDDISLIQKLEKATGKKILPELEGYANYAELLSEKNKTGKFPTAKDVKRKAIYGNIKKAAVGAGVVGGILEGKKILTGH